MLGLSLPRKRSRRSDSPTHSLSEHETIHSPPLHDTCTPAGASLEPRPTAKKPRGPRKGVAGVKIPRVFRNVFREHSWTPLSSTTALTSLYKRTGPGAPGTQWNRDRTIAFIRLVVKTDLPFDDIPTALRDDAHGFAPSEQACLNHWEKIFHNRRPGEARLPAQCVKAREQRRKDLETAYRHYVKHQEALKRGSCVLDEGHGGTSGEQPVDKSANQKLRMQPPTPPTSPDDLPGYLPANVHGIDSATGGTELPMAQLTPAATDPNSSPPAHSTSQSTKPNKPTNRAECARKAGLDPNVLEWIMFGNRRSPVGRVRDSWRSRHSGHYSTDSSHLHKRRSTLDAEVPPLPTLFGSPSTSSPPLCGLLRQAYHEGSEWGTWTELSTQIAQKIINKSAEVTEVDEQGITPLHLATAMGCLPVVAVLLAFHADPNAETNDGLSVSAYSRLFERDNRLPPEHTVHIATVRNAVNYNAELKGIRKSVKDKSNTKDAASQTGAGPSIRQSSSSVLHTISEQDAPQSLSPDQETHMNESTAPASTADSQNREAMIQNGRTTLKGSHGGKIDVASRDYGHRHRNPSRHVAAIEETTDTLQREATSSTLSATSVAIGRSEFFASSVEGPDPPWQMAPDADIVAAQPLHIPQYGFPLMTSPNQSSSTLIPMPHVISRRDFADVGTNLRTTVGQSASTDTGNIHTSLQPNIMPDDNDLPSNVYQSVDFDWLDLGQDETSQWPVSSESTNQPSRSLAAQSSQPLREPQYQLSGQFPAMHDNREEHDGLPLNYCQTLPQPPFAFAQGQSDMNPPQSHIGYDTAQQMQQPVYPRWPHTGHMAQQRLRSAQSVPAFLHFGQQAPPSSEATATLDGFQFDFDNLYNDQFYAYNLQHGTNYYTRQ